MPHKPTCRTQIGIALEDTHRFLNHLLGLHQSMVFGDFSRELALCARLLNLELFPA